MLYVIRLYAQQGSHCGVRFHISAFWVRRIERLQIPGRYARDGCDGLTGLVRRYGARVVCWTGPISLDISIGWTARLQTGCALHVRGRVVRVVTPDDGSCEKSKGEGEHAQHGFLMNVIGVG